MTKLYGSTGSWLSPTRYGETIVWDGQKLHRYPARMRDKARRQQSSTITRAGFDAALIAAGVMNRCSPLWARPQSWQPLLEVDRDGPT